MRRKSQVVSSDRDNELELQSIARSVERLVLLGRHTSCVNMVCDVFQSKDEEKRDVSEEQIQELGEPALLGVRVRWRASGRTNDPFLALINHATDSLCQYEESMLTQASVALDTLRAAFSKRRMKSTYIESSGLPFSFAISWVRALLRCDRRAAARVLLEEYLTSATSILEPYADSEDVAEQLFYLAEAYVLGTLIPMGLISDAEDAINSMPYLRESDVAYFRQQFPSTAAQPENEISCEADTPSAQAPHVKREGSDDATDDQSMHQSPQAPSDSWIDNFGSFVGDITAERAGVIAAATAVLGVSVHYRKRLLWIPRVLGRALRSGGDLLFGE